MPTEYDDSITVRSAQEEWGLGGADEFHWSGGSAKIHGGDNNERYDPNVYGERTGGDRLIVEGNSNVRVKFRSTEDGKAEMSGDTLNFTGIERVYLSSGNDTVNASDASIDRYALSIYADSGNDKIIGSRGGDFIDPGIGDDFVRAGDGEDFVQASRGDDRVFGGGGNDNSRWGQGNFNEAVGDDKISGGADYDLINVWIKDGWLNSGGVSVKVTKVNSEGSMSGKSETDIGGGHSTLKFSSFEQGWTHEGQDKVSGANADLAGQAGMRWNTRWGDDVLIGSRGDDTLEGGDGRDKITGGRGDDLISANQDYTNMNAPGDGVRDELVFRQGDGHDTVLAFDAGVDQLKLGGRDYDIEVTGQGTLLDFGGGDTILLRNVFDYG
jgi:Ca2+-binding RTX toxin-like protein